MLAMNSRWFAITVAVGLFATVVGCGGSNTAPATGTAGGAPQRAKVLSMDATADGLSDIVVQLEGADALVLSGADGAPLSGGADLAGTVPPVASGLGSGVVEFAPFAGAAGGPGAVLHEGRVTEEAVGVPVLKSVAPTSCEPGEVVWIAGHGFRTEEMSADALLGDRPIKPLFVLARFMAIQIPSDASLGATSVRVRRDSLVSEAAPLTVVEIAAPVVESVQPDPLIRSHLAIVEGAHLGRLGDAVVVELGGTRIEKVVTCRSVLLFVVPDDAESGDLVVRRAGSASIAIPVDVEDAPPLSLKAVRPASAPVGAIVTLDLEGLSFEGTSLPRAELDGLDLPLVSMDPSGMSVAIPQGAASGALSVTVGGERTEALTFTVRERENPLIESVEPASVYAGGLALLKGRDLFDVSSGIVEPTLDPGFPPPASAAVYFNSIEAPFALPVEDGLLVAVPESLPRGEALIVVYVGDRSSAAFGVTVE